MTENKITWLIGICNTGADGVHVDKISATVSEAKEYLIRLIEEDRENDEDNWDFGTEDASEVEERTNHNNKLTSLYGYNSFTNYHIDYEATPEKLIVTSEVFFTAEDMLTRLQNGEEFYNMETNEYVFGYNDAGSIAVYSIDYDEARELQYKVEISDEEYWGAFLGAGGKIWDDASCEDKPAPGCSNVSYCVNNYRKEGWVLCSNVPVKED